MTENNSNPLLPNYNFNFELVAGITKIEKGNYLDFLIHRPNGMNGYILHLTVSGRGEVFDGEQKFYAEPGQLLLFSPQALHHYCRAIDVEHWYHKWVYFYPNSRWQNWLSWTHTHNSIGQIKITDKHFFNEVSGLFTKIESELKVNSALTQELSSSLLKYLLIKCVSLEYRSSEFSLDPRIVKVCQIICEDLSQNYGVQQLSDLVYLSPSRLSHLFSQQMGMSLLTYRDKQKIFQAQKQLYFSNISIAQLAKQLGYFDPLYFCKVFKKYTQLSPSQFREQKAKKCD